MLPVKSVIIPVVFFRFHTAFFDSEDGEGFSYPGGLFRPSSAERQGFKVFGHAVDVPADVEFVRQIAFSVFLHDDDVFAFIVLYACNPPFFVPLARRNLRLVHTGL